MPPNVNDRRKHRYKKPSKKNTSDDAVKNLMLDVMPITGEIRSGQEFVNNMQSRPMPYVHDGEIVYPDVKDHTANAMLALAGAVPLVGYGVKGAAHGINKLLELTPTSPAR